MRVSLPKIRIQSEILTDLDKAMGREWIVANGLGGYASSTVLGVNTRKYHGVLVAAFSPPTDRRVLLTKLDEEIEMKNDTYSTGSNEFRDVIYPKGYRFLSSFALDPFPAYRYSIRGVQLHKTMFMPQGKNATIVLYDLFNPGDSEVLIRISPLVNSRHFHSVTDKDRLEWSFVQKSSKDELIIYPSVPLSALAICSSEGKYVPGKGDWVEEMYFRVDSSRRESCLDDSFKPGYFEIRAASGERKRFCIRAAASRNENEARRVLSSIPGSLDDIEDLLNRELHRRRDLLGRFQERYRDVEMKEWVKWLILATDFFIVDRESPRKKSVIAGYHWFEDWGRDSLISLPGLSLVTGRFQDAKEILQTFRHHSRKGLVPNRFPDQTGDTPDYNTVDATLWYIDAVLQYVKYTGDFDFVRKDLWTTLKSIIECHVKGTLYGIHMEDDGLIVHGPQLTWMDAMVDDRFVTPREGKAVEIQALWYNALKIAEVLATHFDDKKEAEKYSGMAEKTRESFIRKFWNAQAGCLFDVVAKEERDSSVRPNQIIAVALDFSMLEKSKGERIVETVQDRLWGTYGLKTLWKEDLRYVGKYLGEWNERNRAYHNGTVWPWLIGPFTRAFLKVKNYGERWRSFAFWNFLKPLFQQQLCRAGLGAIGEIFDGDPPHVSRGCIAQAWSVAEPLRAFVEDVLLMRPPYEAQILDDVSESETR